MPGGGGAGLGGYSPSPSHLAGSAPAALVHFRARGGSPGVVSSGACGPYGHRLAPAGMPGSIGSLVEAVGEALSTERNSGGGGGEEHEMADAAPQVGSASLVCVPPPDPSSLCPSTCLSNLHVQSALLALHSS